MSDGTITLGHCPQDVTNPALVINPFNEIFDYHVNLRYVYGLDHVNGVILWGGEDISPSLYNETPVIGSGPKEPTERDIYEWDILRKAAEKKLPIIGVCRGAQMVCAFAGGKLVQHTGGHCNFHSVTVDATGELFRVTSSHHQMMWPYGVPNHEIVAHSTARIGSQYFGLTDNERIMLMKGEVQEPEVVYFPDINALAIQPHPEWSGNDKGFNDFILNFICDRMFNKVEC
jgi:anthranilate/para-aminobenzoate synthase component II